MMALNLVPKRIHAPPKAPPPPRRERRAAPAAGVRLTQAQALHLVLREFVLKASDRPAAHMAYEVAVAACSYLTTVNAANRKRLQPLVERMHAALGGYQLPSAEVRSSEEPPNEDHLATPRMKALHKLARKLGKSLSEHPSQLENITKIVERAFATDPILSPVCKGHGAAMMKLLPRYRETGDRKGARRRLTAEGIVASFLIATGLLTTKPSSDRQKVLNRVIQAVAEKSTIYNE